MPSGQQALEELFPGLTAELVTHGVPAGDVLANGRWYLNGHRLRQAPTGLVALCASRPLLRTYRLPADALGGDLGVVQAATPQQPRSGVLLLLEGDRWMLTLGGRLGDHPPTDPDGFLDFARSLQFPDIYEAIRNAQPLDDPVAFRFPASVRHRYERLDRFPDGLLVMGDAVCSFNPVYAQGMSVAAWEALILRRHLQRGAAPQPRDWFGDLARVVDVPWAIAVGGDLAFPGVPGRRTPKVRLVNAYLARLHAAAHDASLAGAFLGVAGLVALPQSLLRPGVAVRVLRASLRPATGTVVSSNRDTVRAAPTLADSGNVSP
jgi:hypothetical protein